LQTKKKKKKKKKKARDNSSISSGGYCEFCRNIHGTDTPHSLESAFRQTSKYPLKLTVVSLCATICPCVKNNFEDENGVVVDGYRKRKIRLLRKKFLHSLNTKQNNVKFHFFPILPDTGKSIPLFESSHYFSSCPSLNRRIKMKTCMEQWWNDGDSMEQWWHDGDSMEQWWNDDDSMEQWWNDGDSMEQWWNDDDSMEQWWNDSDSMEQWWNDGDSMEQWWNDDDEVKSVHHRPDMDWPGIGSGSQR